jgi:catechol 2,3-dioxygenase
MQEHVASAGVTGGSADEPVFRSRRLGHVNFFVDDLARSTRFYNAVCGLALEFTEAGLKASFLGTGHTPHDIGCIETTKGQDRRGRDGHLQIPKEVGVQAGLNHIAWEIDNEADLVASYERCVVAGIKINRLADHQIAHSIYMQDPDGNVVEFYVDTVRDWRSVLHGELDLITTVWDPRARRPDPAPRYETEPVLRHVAAAPVHPRRLSHAVLASRTPDRLAEFYIRVAGLRRCGTATGAVHILRGSAGPGDRHLVIVPAAGGEPAGLHHVSLELADASEVDRSANALAARGTPIERSVATARKRSIFVRDPDGQRIEFFARIEDGSRDIGATRLDAFAV